MAGTIKGITVEIGGNTGPLSKALEGVNKTSRDLQGELRQVEKLLKLDPTNTELLAQKQKLLADSVDNTKNKLNSLKEAENQVQQQFKEGKISEEQYRALQREIVSTEKNLESLEKSLKTTNDKWSDFGNKAKEVGGKITSVGKGMSIGITAPILGIGAASQVAWEEVDEALDTITTKTGATGKAADELQQSFKSVAGNIPADLQTVGDAIGEVNTQFGITGEKLDNATEKVIKFAQINGQDVSQTAINARQAIEAYGLSADDLGSVLDAVTKTAQNTGQSTSDLFSKVTDGSPQIKSLGLDFAQATELIGRFEQKGIDSSKALSYLSKAQVTFAKDGKTLEQGLQEVTEKIKNSSSETEALTIASQAFGTKGATFMVDAIKRGALSLDDLANASKNASGSLETTFQNTLDPADKAKVAMNNLKISGAELSDTIQVTLAPVLEKIVVLLQKFATWFSGLSDNAKIFIVVIGALLAAIGPAVIIIGQIVTAVGVLAGVFSTVSAAITAAGGVMTILTGPIGIVIAAIAAAIAIGILLYKNWDTIKEACNTAWEAIKNTISNAINRIKSIFNTIIEFVKNNWQALLLLLVNPFAGAFKLLYDNCDGFRNFIDGFIDKVVGFFKQLPGKIWNAIIGIKDKFSNLKTELINWANNNLPSFIAKFVEFMLNLPNKMVNIGKNIVEGIWNGITGATGWLKDKITGFASGIVNTIKDKLSIHSPSRVLADEVGKYMAQGIGVGFENEMSSVSMNMAKAVPTQREDYTNSDVSSSNSTSSSSSELTINTPVYLDGKSITTVVSKVQYRNGRLVARGIGVQPV